MQKRTPFLKKKLENGEFAMANDRKLFHNAAPITATAEDEEAHWDLFVLTANKS